MIDFNEIVSKYNTKIENESEYAVRVASLYSELNREIAKEIKKMSCLRVLIPVVSAALELNAKTIMRPYEDDELLTETKAFLFEHTKCTMIDNSLMTSGGENE